MKNTILTFASFFIIVFSACNKDTENISLDSEFDYSVPSNINYVSGIAINSEKANLGRLLFYDPALSLNGKISCGSCHVQSLGFADGKAKSEGFLSKNTNMHSMALVNTSMSSAFFWDGRATNLFEQVLLPISDHIEMGISEESLLLAKVEGNPIYREKFKTLFHDQKITSKNIGDALGNFVASLVSYNSKFDLYKRGEVFLTSEEMEGLNLFEKKYECNSCHGGDNFNTSWGSTAFAAIGLKTEVKGANNQVGVFKVPNLRNVEKTAPYMHDGRFATLEQVIDHYSHGIDRKSNVDWRLTNVMQQPNGLKFTDDEKKALIAFLKTLTDHKMLTDVKFSNPY